LQLNDTDPIKAAPEAALHEAQALWFFSLEAIAERTARPSRHPRQQRFAFSDLACPA
jgi:hypothetical protein